VYAGGVERKIFWITFTILGLAADFVLPLWCDHPQLLLELVGGLSQRLVLANAATRRFYLVVSSGCRAVFRRRHRCFCRGIRRHHRHGLLWDALR
jgi:hypothetical protein